MNFTTTIKNETINKKMNKKEMLSFISGFLYCLSEKENNYEFRMSNLDFLNFLIEQFKKYEIIFQKQNNKILVPKDQKQFVDIGADNATSFFAGIFFATGSISNLDSSSYHLEISFKNVEHAQKICEFGKKHIQFNQIQNKNNYVLYLKKNEAIQDFLTIIGVKKSYFSFIDSIIERDMKNQITRIFNLDVHNQNRLVDSNQNFNECWDYVKQHHLESEFKDEQILFYEFKKNNPYLSLSQLSEEFSKKTKIIKTKSGLNHWLIKLRNVCEEHENKK